MSVLTAHRSFRLLLVAGLIAVAASFSSCRPRGVLSSHQMRDVLVDLHRTFALIQLNGLQYGHNEATDNYYAYVLQEHGITQAQFDSSLVWYTAHPQLFDKIYPKVLAQLEGELQTFDAEYAELLKTPLPMAPSDARRMTLQQAEYRTDSVLWVMRNGYPSPWHPYSAPAQIPYAP